MHICIIYARVVFNKTGYAFTTLLYRKPEEILTREMNQSKNHIQNFNYKKKNNQRSILFIFKILA